MQRYKIYLFSAICSLFLFSACESDENFDNKVFTDTETRVDNLIIKPNIESDTRTLQAAITRPENHDIVVTYKADISLVDQYNKAYNDNAIALPNENYELEKPQVTIAAGSVRSTETTLLFKDINQLDRDIVYVLPVTIANAGIEILQSARTNYFVIKGGALINVVADMEDNYLHPDPWANPGVLNNLSQVTMEALIRARNFDRLISTVMGIEGKFLIRIGDAGFPPNQIQIATSKGNFPQSDSNKGLPVNEWTHIALTYDSSDGQFKLYVNGRLQSDAKISLGKINLGDNNFYIGRSYEDSRFLAGEISECRIWDVVRTPEEIAGNIYQVEPNSTGLVAYWKCDEGSGNIVKDHTGNGNNLLSKKAITWTPVSLPPKK